MTERPTARTDGAPVPSPDEQDVSAEQLSLARRLRQPRTIASLVVPLIVLLLILVNLPGFKLDRLPSLILAANGGLLVAAFVVYYAGFPLRGERWALLLRNTGLRIGWRDASEIIFLSWLVNCLVPAKLGDVYRAWLLKINSDASLSRTFGTVFIERILDLFAIVTLGLAAGFVSFRKGLPGDVQLVFAIGVGFVVVLAVGLLTMRNFGCTSSSRRSGCPTSISASAAPSSWPCARRCSPPCR
jgi:uncharacterized protein (TIRG00374 family)